MKKILINRKPVNGPYGGGNLFVKEFCSYFNKKGYSVVHSFEPDIDVILLMDPRYDELGISINEIYKYKVYNQNVKIIHRINENDARKSTNDIDELLRSCSRISDVSCFVGNWLMEYHLERGWSCQECIVVRNGCDRDIFKPNKKFINGKINIISHHWSNNQLKNQGLHEWLDNFVNIHKDFTFTFIGRLNEKLNHSTVIAPLFGEALGSELGKYDVYINKSYADPFPNSVIEAISCGLPTYVHIDGGGGCEAAGFDHVWKSFVELEELLLKKSFSQNTSFIPEPWDVCMRQYESIIQNI